MNSDEKREEGVKREDFKTILCDLANSQEILEDKKKRSEFYIRLENLYYAPEGKFAFRHFYSDIFSVLCQIQNGDIEGNIDVLGQNLEVLKSGYQSQNLDKDGNLIDITRSITKLYDHVSLDIARMHYSDAGDRVVSGEDSIKKSNESIQLISESLEKLKADNENLTQSNEKLTKINDELTKNINKLSHDMQKTQRDYITILGIFASILAAFFSGIGFSSSVLANFNSGSVYRLILVVLLLGWILFDILTLLFKFIYDISDKPFERNIFIGILNVLFLALVALLFYSWKFNWLGETSF